MLAPTVSTCINSARASVLPNADPHNVQQVPSPNSVDWRQHRPRKTPMGNSRAAVHPLAQGGPAPYHAGVRKLRGPKIIASCRTTLIQQHTPGRKFPWLSTSICTHTGCDNDRGRLHLLCKMCSLDRILLHHLGSVGDGSPLKPGNLDTTATAAAAAAAAVTAVLEVVRTPISQCRGKHLCKRALLQHEHCHSLWSLQ